MVSATLETILLYEAHDLEVMEAFLPSFLVLKVASDSASQKAWDGLLAKAQELHGVGVGLIRQEWKQSSNFFCQRYGVKHVSPQLVLVHRRRAEKVWQQAELADPDLIESLERLQARYEGKLASLVAFGKLAQLGELESKDPLWHEKWLESFGQALGFCELSAARAESLELFTSEWQRRLQGPWAQLEAGERSQFFAEAQQQHRLWWKEVSQALL